MTDNDDDDIIAPPLNDDLVQTPVSGDDVSDDDVTDSLSEDDDVVEPSADVDTDNSVESGGINYDETSIDFRGESDDVIAELLQAAASEGGMATLEENIRSTGTWENVLYRAYDQPNREEIRIQAALASFGADEIAKMTSRYKEDGKTKLRTSAIYAPAPAGQMRNLVGEDAIAAFEQQEKGGSVRLPLYNSGITLDLVVPTGNDLQTLLSNCINSDRDLGTSSGAHYFIYADVVNKTHILSFLRPLIVNSSYNDWKKPGKLWNIIKLPDLPAIVATLAALCYRDGFNNFVTKCTRPVSTEHPHLCKHTEKINLNILDLIVTRWSVMSKEAIDFMVAARGGTKNTAAQIAKYQANMLGLEGERITFGKITFVMRIPTLTEHTQAGSKFIADIMNEVNADNNEGRYDQFGLRFIRTLLPWVASVELTNDDGGGYSTAEPNVITRLLEKLDDDNETSNVREQLVEYVNKTQLTYVGYPVLPCPSCGYTAQTPSGMWTIDPFNAFFTLAFLSLTKAV